MIRTFLFLVFVVVVGTILSTLIIENRQEVFNYFSTIKTDWTLVPILGLVLGNFWLDFR